MLNLVFSAKNHYLKISVKSVFAAKKKSKMNKERTFKFTMFGSTSRSMKVQKGSLRPGRVPR